MAFALWLDGEQAWVQGLHEYRPMGVAVVAVTDRFRPRDFEARRTAPSRQARTYAGLFASLDEVNFRLALARRSQAGKNNRAPRGSVTPAWV